MAKQIVTRDTPLAELTLRRYEKPYDLHKRELVKKLCLSIGLLNPGDSRDIIVDIFMVLLEARKEGKTLTSEEVTANVIEKRKQEKLKLLEAEKIIPRREKKEQLQDNGKWPAHRSLCRES